MTTQEILENAKAAKTEVSLLSIEQRNAALLNMADAIEADTDAILEANAVDMENAKGKLSEVMMDRLALSASRIHGIAEGLREAEALPDPVGEVREEFTRPNGIHIQKVSVPLGVIAIIYESRPNVTADSAALCLKSGNVSVLRTGKEAWRSANALVIAMRKGLEKVGITKNAINLIEDTTRASSTALMTANGYVDLLIPRGGKGLIDACLKGATVPCIQTGTGICHVYVDKAANQDMALTIIENAKCQRPSVCNAMEVCLVDKAIAAEFLPKLYDKLTNRSKPVTFKLDEAAWAILGARDYTVQAGEGDFDTEFLDYKMAVKVVDGVREAIAHISLHSTSHSDAIVTDDPEAGNLFTRSVDSAAVYWNASTRFTDGGVFGQGCEIGISTQKLHARGPMGLRELTSYKYVITGNGQIRT
ncbi:MAG: glutamate-5-semialdehyde dehydrogenase [Clostridia bacterium]|nr:glutamate-5-semialdehyde dehydrogenase [Clostridia bacterium]